MSDRERWIIYPLLFLAMGASLRDKLFGRTTSKSIVCQELIVVDDDRGGRQPLRVLARIGGTEGSGEQPIREGQMVIAGQLLVEQIRVGTITADNYSYQGIPFAPTLRAVFPGLTPADVLRALQNAAGTPQSGASSAPPAQPPNDQPGDRDAPPAEPATPAQPPAQSPSEVDET